MILQDSSHEIEIDGFVAQQLFDWFWDVNRGRQVGMNGWLALSATELHAWAEITGNRPSPQEMQVIREMDQTYLREAMKSPEDRRERPQLTTAAFDSVFG